MDAFSSTTQAATQGAEAPLNPLPPLALVAADEGASSCHRSVQTIFFISSGPTRVTHCRAHTQATRDHPTPQMIIKKSPQPPREHNALTFATRASPASPLFHFAGCRAPARGSSHPHPKDRASLFLSYSYL